MFCLGSATLYFCPEPLGWLKRYIDAIIDDRDIFDPLIYVGFSPTDEHILALVEADGGAEIILNIEPHLEEDDRWGLDLADTAVFDPGRFDTSADELYLTFKHNEIF